LAGNSENSRHERMARALEIVQDARTCEDTDASSWESTHSLRIRVSRTLGNLVRLLKEGGASSVDGLALEVDRPFRAILSEGREAARVRAFGGTLGRIFERFDPYEDSPRYPFFQWRTASALVICLAGSDCAEPVAPVKGAHLTISAACIEDAVRSYPESQEAQLDQIRSYGAFDPCLAEQEVEQAAQVALHSTSYSRLLMCSDRLQELGRKVGRKRLSKVVSQLGLPHEDWRSVSYLPVLARGNPIGGAVLYSRRPVCDESLLIIGWAVHVLVPFIRSIDELSAIRLASVESARWRSSYMYLSRIRHDVRKPLDSLIEIANETWKDRHADESDLREVIRRLAGKLQEYSATLSGRVGVSLEVLQADAKRRCKRTSIMGLLESATWMGERVADERGIALDVRVTGSLRTALVPKQHVSEALSNLVDNAVRFARSSVLVEAGVVRRPNGGSTLRCVVKDDGRGLTKARLRKLSLIGEETDAGEGGLGLPLARYILEDILGGRLGLTSGDNGTVVECVIPIGSVG